MFFVHFSLFSIDTEMMIIIMLIYSYEMFIWIYRYEREMKLPGTRIYAIFYLYVRPCSTLVSKRNIFKHSVLTAIIVVLKLSEILQFFPHWWTEKKLFSTLMMMIAIHSFFIDLMILLFLVQVKKIMAIIDEKNNDDDDDK